MRPQMGVQRIPDLARPDILAQIEMGDLSCRVYAGVRSPGADHLNRRTIERFGCLLERLLHGRRAVLPLPARESAAIVFQSQLIAGQWEPRMRPEI